MDRNKQKKKKKIERRRKSSSSSSLEDERISSSKRKWKADRTSSSSSGSSSEEWEEKIPRKSTADEGKKSHSGIRDDWMNVESLVPTMQREKKEKKKDINRAIIADPGQTDRELNPYWKNGGTGLPSEEKDLHVSSSSVGDRGLEWYQKAFQRAQETAKEENRSLEEVVSERWGSLEKLKSLISTAELKQGRSRNDDRRDDHRRHRRHSKDGERRKVDDRNQYKFHRPRDGDGEKRHHRYDRDIKNREYDHHESISSDRTPSRNFLKPGEEYGRSSEKRQYDGERGRNWMKHKAKEKIVQPKQDDSKIENSESSSANETKTVLNQSSKEPDKSDVQLSDDQLNALAAKLVKAEIMGNAALAEKLKAKLEEARCNRKAGSFNEKSGSKEETIVLLQTNEKGLTRPVQGPSTREPTGGRRKKHNVPTHSDGQRVRYFADDDKHDLKTMFEREKLGTMDDDKEMFLRLAARKRPGAGSDEEDAAFADAARVKESDGKVHERERNKAIREETRRRKTMDGCAWCLDNKARLKHLVVSVGETCYLCLPAEESLTPLHCLIVPIQHTACGTLLDEDVWEEMHKFRKAITAMASSKEQDLIMFEQAVNLRNNPHMVLHCVILDKEVGDLAPIYFKKAILDSETEWSNNKKVVDIKGPDVRRSVPKGLPYFSVEFPDSNGFAHVIEDEKYFPKNFAQEIIGGMLDLDHRKWRKPQKSNFSAQRDKTQKFIKEWSDHDFTKKNIRSYSSSSSSSSESESD